LGLVKKATRVLFREGPRSFLAKSMLRGGALLTRAQPAVSLVDLQLAAKVDWTTPAPFHVAGPAVVKGGVKTAWLMSPPGRSSGGHQNIFRFMDFLEQAGHSVTIYICVANGVPVDIGAIEVMLNETAAYPSLHADIHLYDPEVGVDPSIQAIFATGWETAYPSYLDSSSARRFYFVQDFEAGFYPLGSESILAENTYRFGFHGISAGGWLAQKLRADYSMRMDHFDFAVESSVYHHTNDAPRTEIFFYARPVTPRRAFEFGVLSLAKFATMRPDIGITLAGWDTTAWEVPFAHTNLANLDISQLNAVYNRCTAGLVMSLSNMSLLPLELMASGVVPVVNEGDNNRMVSDSPYIEYVPLSPAAIARKLVDIVDRPDADAAAHARTIAKSVESLDWADSGRQFIRAFEEGMRG
jgi:hypothetical protein